MARESALGMFISFRDGNTKNRKGITCEVKDKRLISRRFERILTAEERRKDSGYLSYLSRNLLVNPELKPFVYAVYTKNNQFVANGDLPPHRVMVPKENVYKNAGVLGHSRLMTQVFSEAPKVSFVCLDEAGIDYQEIEIVNSVLDTWYTYSLESGIMETYTLIAGGKHNTSKTKMSLEEAKEFFRSRGFTPSRTTGWGDRKNELLSLSAHSLGAAVFRYKDRYFLSARDEGRYFISELPCKVDTVEQAYKALRPKEVQKAFEEGKEVLRQGEWFFVPLSEAEAHALVPNLQEELQLDSLPTKRAGGSLHTCSLAYGENRTLVCTGTVKHNTMLNGKLEPTYEHSDLELKGYYAAYCNTSINDWSVSGKGVD